MGTLQTKFDKLQDAKDIRDSCLQFEIEKGNDSWALAAADPAWLVLSPGGKLRIVRNRVKSAKEVPLSEFLRVVLDPIEHFNLFRISFMLRRDDGWEDLKYIAQDCIDRNIPVFYKKEGEDRFLCPNIQKIEDEGLQRHYYYYKHLDCGLNVNRKYLIISERSLSNYYKVDQTEFLKLLLKLNP